MNTTAQLNHLRISPRKARDVARVIIGMDVDKARDQLSHIVRKSSRPIKKLLESAVANAIHNHSMIESNLYIKEIIVNEGIILKRSRPKGFGRVAPINKRTSRIKVVLGERKAGLRMSESEKAELLKNRKSKNSHKAHKAAREVEKEKNKPEIEKEIKKDNVFKGIKNLSRKLFRHQGDR